MAIANEVLIIGGGIGGLTLALQLEQAGVPARVLEAVPDLQPLGVGINILPHASKELWGLGLQDRLSPISVATSSSVFYNRFGQHIHSDPAGKAAGYPWPQYSIHRGKLQTMLADAVRERLGEDRLVLDARVTEVEDRGDSVVVHTVDTSGNAREWVGDVAIGCDGIRSVVRRSLHPEDPDPLYSGYTMWRGTTRMKSFLDGASMVRAGWLETGKMVIYPILDFGDGTQLINWVAEIEAPQRSDRDWTRNTSDTEFMVPFADWKFDWLDVPEMLGSAEAVFEYPMVDQDPLEFWTKGRITLLGDAAHPMVPRGSNGAGQAILDTRALRDALVEEDPQNALRRYESERLPRTADVVRLNRSNPPDAILREVFVRSGDRPFDSIDDVISPDEMRDLLDRYRAVTGSSLDKLHESAS
ncbi:flavin-dependent oxidoreductase [Rhodococcus globerulus]|uniref:Flavin-dependent oxidoreductase n=1 Tax=Rhodococcus globerulus TaxID=33008 RepID=A0ABU4C401_RHOGO|nr:flavin-dependent oxidoreductase [Rhodococcus globerulus]MDV6271014.1 flavin-dependent oxidoreductase [Rhodococcus globerulus]